MSIRTARQGGLQLRRRLRAPLAEATVEFLAAIGSGAPASLVTLHHGSREAEAGHDEAS